MKASAAILRERGVRGRSSGGSATSYDPLPRRAACEQCELPAVNRALEHANVRLAAANTVLKTQKILEVMELNRILAQANVQLRKEIGERARAERDAELHGARYQSLVQSAAQIVWTMDAGGAITVQSASEGNLKWDDHGAIHPGDLDRMRQAWRAAGGARSVFVEELRLRRRDGRYRIMVVRAVPIVGEEDEIREWVGMCTDVTSEREAAAHRELLLAELDHRVKNMLAVVQSIAMHTQRTVDAPARFHEVFMGRLHSLARAHDLLTREKWEGTGLEDLIRAALSPYEAAGAVGARVAVDGPRVRLAPVIATSLAMAFHELAANAVQYGALANGAGRVAVAWRPAETEAVPSVELTWVERGGPPVVEPTRRGFGTRLVERSIPIELGGRARLDFLREGLQCRLWLPLSDKVVLA